MSGGIQPGSDGAMTRKTRTILTVAIEGDAMVERSRKEICGAQYGQVALWIPGFSPPLVQFWHYGSLEVLDVRVETRPAVADPPARTPFEDCPGAEA